MKTEKQKLIVKPSDNRATPKWLKDIFDGYFDPCPLNPIPEVNGLELEWKDKTFLNPPYSCPADWIYKAIEESKKGKRIVILMRFDPTTKYFKALIENNAHLFYCGERLEFITPENKEYKSPFPSIIVILNNDKLHEINKRI